MTRTPARPSGRVIEPDAHADEDATIAELARAFVDEWEEAEAREVASHPTATAETAKGEPPPARGPSTGRRILIVDDEPLITRTLQLALEQFGHTITAFNQPEQALAHFAADPGGFDAIITDFRMPKVDGLELARRIRALSPKVGIILFSGFAVPLTTAQERQLDLTAQLCKPVEISRLAAILNRFFDARKAPNEG